MLQVAGVVQLLKSDRPFGGQAGLSSAQQESAFLNIRKNMQELLS